LSPSFSFAFFLRNVVPFDRKLRRARSQFKDEAFVKQKFFGVPLHSVPDHADTRPSCVGHAWLHLHGSLAGLRP
jgi:hypothetical protein